MFVFNFSYDIYNTVLIRHQILESMFHTKNLDFVALSFSGSNFPSKLLKFDAALQQGQSHIHHADIQEQCANGDTNWHKLVWYFEDLF